MKKNYAIITSGVHDFICSVLLSFDSALLYSPLHLSVTQRYALLGRPTLLVALFSDCWQSTLFLALRDREGGPELDYSGLYVLRFKNPITLAHHIRLVVLSLRVAGAFRARVLLFRWLRFRALNNLTTHHSSRRLTRVRV